MSKSSEKKGTPLQLTEQEILQHSKDNPNQIYNDENGRIAFQGTLFENEREFKLYLKLLGRFRWLFKLLAWFKK